MLKIINLTSEDVNLAGNFLKSNQANQIIHSQHLFTMDNLRINELTYTFKVPPISHNTIYIVPREIAYNMDRKDFYVLDEPIIKDNKLICYNSLAKISKQ